MPTGSPRQGWTPRRAPAGDAGGRPRRRKRAADRADRRRQDARRASCPRWWRWPRRRAPGLHTLYVSPLKALATDIARNLTRPVEEMRLAVSIETRTGDTPANRRARQRADPPNILLTTPESLAVLLSLPDAPAMFAGLASVVMDEVHALAGTKRGDQLALCVARLATLAPRCRRVGLSATVAHPAAIRAYVGADSGDRGAGRRAAGTDR